MQERTHLELKRLAERCKASMEQVEETLAEVRPRYDGPRLLQAIASVENVYPQLAELISAEKKQQTDKGLAEARKRFKPDTIQHWQEPDMIGSVRLTSSLQCAGRAVAALAGLIQAITEPRDLEREANEAFDETANTLHEAYLMTTS